MENIWYVQNNIELDFAHMEKFIFGKDKEWFAQEAKKILEWLWFTVEGASVWIPFWRSPDDINIPEDVYEEVARMYGYENIEAMPLSSVVELPKTSPLVNLIRKVEEVCVRNYKFDQVESYPRVWGKNLELFGVDFDTMYKLKNPIDTDKPWMRDDLDYVLIEYVSKNSKFFEDFKIFDIGRIWSKDFANQVESKFADEFVGEKLQFSAMYYHKSNKWRESDNLLIAKWELEDMLCNFGLKGSLSYESTDQKEYHPKKQGNISYWEEVIWFVWAVHPLVLKENKLSENADLVYISLDLQKISDLIQKVEFKPEWYETLQDQIVWRDLCFVIDQDKDFDIVLDTAKNVQWVSDLEVFDLYKWDNLPEGKKSVAFKIKIKWENMQTEQINEVMNSVIKKVESIWAKLRD